MKRIVDEEMLRLEGSEKPYSGKPNVLIMQFGADNTVANVILDGVITSEMQNDFADELLACLSSGLNLRLDMSKVTYIAPDVVGKMIKLQYEYVEPLGLQMLLFGMSKVLLEWFRENHYIQQFNIERRA